MKYRPLKNWQQRRRQKETARQYRQMRHRKYRALRERILQQNRAERYAQSPILNRIYQILQFWQLPSEILILIFSPLVQRLKTADWMNCEVS